MPDILVLYYSRNGATAELARYAAESPLVFPDEDTLAGLSTYRELGDDDEIAEWNEAFGEFYL